jgi:hypothetical protein
MKDRKIFSLIISLISILILCSALIIAINVKSSQQLDNEQEIKKTVIGALKLAHGMLDYPAEYTKSPDIQIPQEVVNRKLKEITQACEKYYSNKYGWMANRLEIYKNAVLFDAYPSSFKPVEHKMTDIKFLEIKINGDKATVVVDVFGGYKSVGLALDTDTIPPSELNEITNAKGYKMSAEEQKRFIEKAEKLPKKVREYKVKFGERYGFNLEKENGEWKITSETFNFLPGYEP